MVGTPQSNGLFMNINIPAPDKDYKVLIKCPTYNHSKYICDALNGFAIQETKFPFVCIVVDDASKDGNQDVIKQYAKDNCDMTKADISEDDISTYIRVSHKTNSNCFYLFCLLKINLYGKPEKQEIYKQYRSICEYEAICEGDDYWTVSSKLQKQVDWLDTHESCQMCCSDAHIITSKEELNWARYEADTDIHVEDIILGGGLFVQTCTLLYKKGLMANYPDSCKKCHVGDYPLQIWAALNGNVHYFSEKTSAYRFAIGNSWTARNQSSDIEKKIRGIRSEIDMLKTLDSYSDCKYHDTFKKRQCDFIYQFSICGNNGMRSKEEITRILSSFEDVYQIFSISQKTNLFFLSHDMIFAFKVKRKIGDLLRKL